MACEYEMLQRVIDVGNLVVLLSLTRQLCANLLLGIALLEELIPVISEYTHGAQG